MFSWQELGEQLKQIIVTVIRFIKARRREEASLAFAALLLWFGYKFSGLLTPELTEFLKPWRGVLIVQVIFYLAGLALLIYAFLRIKRLVWVEALPPAKDRPSAIKGPMAFTEADGELFRKLGRESELQKLLGLMLDDQVLMVVIRGASGAGKTSLLRAGLKHILGNQAIFHYWEAVPTEPDKGLLRAIQEKWPEGAGRPATLDELVNPADTLGRQSHVIVLDQFEQLRGSRKIFQLLRRIVRESKPPHRITWVIAFRREFSADWMDFVSPELERGFRPPQDVSLRLFTAEQAREVIGQLVNESNLKDSIEQSVINNLVEAATVESEVSPVDIGIGLLVLAELHERQSGNTITIRDYQFAGGAEGLLTQYISRCLELFPKESQEAILKAMLALRDPESNQRLAEGLTVDELATESGAEARLLKTQLDRLSHRDTRLLETVTPTDGSAVRYRLPHERLIPALYRLTGKLLAEVDQAKLKFQNAFQAWRTNDKRSHYLLKAKELRLAERYETQIPWGNDEQEKKNFLHRSKQRRTFVQVTLVTMVLALIGVGWWASLQYQRLEDQRLEYQLSNDRRYLRDSGYPSGLYDWQHQLKKLELTARLDLERFTWLSSYSVEELKLHAAPLSNSIAGLASLSRCHSLIKLTLDLSYQVRDLEPLSKLSNLTQLTLNLGGSQVRDLEPLSKLSNLTQLTLDVSGSHLMDLEPLSKLSNLTHLTLSFGYSREMDLEPLSKLSNLMQLTLGQVRDLEPLSKLSNLTQLTLSLSGKVRILKPLSKLSNLTQLTFDLHRSQVSDWGQLSKLSNLPQLTFGFHYSRYSQVRDLEPLSKLNNLTQLTFDLSGSEVSNLEPLSKLSNLTQLTFDLSGSEVSNLEPLSKLSNLTQLTFDLSGSHVRDLEPLSKLSNLTQLTLDLSDSQVSNLEPLSKLSNRTQLTLDLNSSQVSNMELLSKLSNLTQLTLSPSGSDEINLEPLSKLSNLTQLTLDLNSSQVSNIELLSKLSNLTQLTLDLSDSQVNNLEALSKLSKLTQLTIKLSNDYGETSKVSNLEPLSTLTSLKSLSIKGATRAQRMSLRNLPASLVELKF